MPFLSLLLRSFRRKNPFLLFTGEHLPSLFAKLIQTNIPSLKAAAEAHIADARERRRRLGDAPLSTAQMISEVQRVLLSPSKDFSETLTPFIENFREDVHATEKRVTLDWVGKTYRHDAFKPPFFQSQATFDRCMVEIVDWWKDPVICLSESVRTALVDTLDPLEYETVGVSRCLVNALKTAWKDASTGIMAALDAGVTVELKREVAFGTTNHYLAACLSAPVYAWSRISSRHSRRTPRAGASRRSTSTSRHLIAVKCWAGAQWARPPISSASSCGLGPAARDDAEEVPCATLLQY